MVHITRVIAYHKTTKMISHSALKRVGARWWRQGGSKHWNSAPAVTTFTHHQIGILDLVSLWIRQLRQKIILWTDWMSTTTHKWIFLWTWHLLFQLAYLQRTHKMLQWVLWSCCNLSLGVALNVQFTTNGTCTKNNTIYMWHEQAIIEWARRVISIVACCQCEALRTCRSGFPITTILSKLNNVHLGTVL